MITAFLVRWAGGWHEVTDDTAVALHGRHEALLGLGALASVDEVERVARLQLDLFARSRVEIAAEVWPRHDDERPFVGYHVGDTIEVPGLSGALTRERVTAVTVAEDDDGVVTYAPELKDVLLTQAERLEQGLKKMADGTVRGQSSVAQPIGTINLTIGKDCCPPTGSGEVVWSSNGCSETRSEAYTVRRGERITAVTVTGSAEHAPATFMLWRNGTIVHQGSYGPGAFDVTEAVDISTDPGDELSWTVAAGGYDDVVVDVTGTMRGRYPYRNLNSLGGSPTTYTFVGADPGLYTSRDEWDSISFVSTMHATLRPGEAASMEFQLSHDGHPGVWIEGVRHPAGPNYHVTEYQLAGSVTGGLPVHVGGSFGDVDAYGPGFDVTIPADEVVSSGFATSLGQPLHLFVDAIEATPCIDRAAVTFDGVGNGGELGWNRGVVT